MNNSIKTNDIKYLLFFSLAALILFVMPEFAFAQSSPFDSVESKGNEILIWASGSLWAIISGLALLGVAGFWLWGKLSIPQALTVAAAIILGFSVVEIVAALRN